jgi:hypothetical protein
LLSENFSLAASILLSTWMQAAGWRKHLHVGWQIAMPVAGYSRDSDLLLPIPN